MELLIEQLCSAAHTGLRNFAQPLFPMAWGIDLPSPAVPQLRYMPRADRPRPCLVFADA